MHILRSYLAALLLACVTGSAAADDASHEADLAALRGVVQQFQSAIVTRDVQSLGALFLPDQNSWLSVLDAPSYASAKARNPAAHQVTPSTSQKFIAFVAASEQPVEERFSKVRIETNGAVASVYFDFDFLVAGAVTNRGSESWQLVHVDDGWKISSMLYSVGP